jgi:membrane associated rhomboid family serine protease
MLPGMFSRREGRPEICAWCRALVGVNATECPSCGRRNPTLWGFARQLRDLGADLGFVNLVMYGCGAMYLLGLLLTAFGGGDVLGTANPLGMLAASPQVQFRLGASGASPVFEYGMWWTVLSAAWLHGGLLHIVFNMMSFRNLAPGTAELYGPARTVIIYTVGSAAGFGLSSASYFLGLQPFFGAALTLGASAPILGLVGALMYYGRKTGSRHVKDFANSYVVGLIMMGFLMLGVVDNAAHLGGFIGGYVAGMLLDPQHEERMGHVIAALLCLVLTAGSILMTMLYTGLPQWVLMVMRARAAL